MPHPPSEALTPPARWLHDVGTLALLALILVPCYLLLNQYWQSVFLFMIVYSLLGLGFWRLGRYVRRVMRRTPAEIPPWRGSVTHPASVPLVEVQFSTAEAIQSVYQDPHYLQDVMKPRLCQLLAYRISGMPEASLDTLTPLQRAGLDPAMLDFIQRRNPTGLWGRYRYRQQRVRDVLAIIRHLEAL